MLNKTGIMEAIKNGDIYVDGVLENSNLIGDGFIYVTLGPDLKVYTNEVLDFKNENQSETIKIPSEGYKLEPNKLYLGRTLEYTKTLNFVPKINGLPNVENPGLYIHVSAGFGDVGFEGTWTLEIMVPEGVDVTLYEGMPIGIIHYDKVIGNTDIMYEGKYLGQVDATASKAYRDESDIADYHGRRR